MQPALVIFDCDGVLVDSEPISIGVLVDVIARAGHEMGEAEAYDRFLGKSMASITEILNDEFGFVLTDHLLEKLRLELYRRFRAELQPIEGIRQAASMIDTPSCVASSSQVERIRLSLTVTGLLDLFDGRIFSSSMVENGKPAPDLFLHAARQMGADPSDCLVIEDSLAGIVAARAAGMRVFAFVGASHARSPAYQAAVSALEPDAVFEDMRDLPALIKGEAIAGSQAAARDCVVAVDVGTGSARAGVLSKSGALLGRAEVPIAMNRPALDHAEHDSEDIWRAVCKAVHDARNQAGIAADRIAAIGFDATCSLVLRGQDGEPVALASDDAGCWDTLVWLDHRAKAETDECTATGHTVLDHVGGAMSPEMQVPKLMWLKRHRPDIWARAGQIFDLVDFLTWKASGSNARSQCTLTSKWTYLAHEDEPWRRDFLSAVGLDDMIECCGLPERATPVATDLGPLTAQAAADLDLDEECRVAAGLIDAHAGALGVLGSFEVREESSGRMALIAGTSSCVMTLSARSTPVAGIWGPYLGAVLPGRWLIEGGQSATGALLDHIVRLHGAGGEPTADLHARIIARIAELRQADGPDFAGRLHVLPDFHGNRSPHGDQHAVGVISGLSLDSSFDGLCRLYWRTCVALALGIRQILDHLAAAGYPVETLHLAGGHARNPLLVELYADATGCNVAVLDNHDAVLLGTAMAAAAGGGLFDSLDAACSGMRREGIERRPDTAEQARLERDYRVFLEMQQHRRKLDELAGA